MISIVFLVGIFQAFQDFLIEIFVSLEVFD